GRADQNAPIRRAAHNETGPDLDDTWLRKDRKKRWSAAQCMLRCSLIEASRKMRELNRFKRHPTGQAIIMPENSSAVPKQRKVHWREQPPTKRRSSRNCLAVLRGTHWQRSRSRAIGALRLTGLFNETIEG